MKALGCQEAKWNIAFSWTGDIQSRNRRGDDGRCFAGTLSWRLEFGWCMFDGHFGIHEVVQTVRDNMTAS